MARVVRKANEVLKTRVAGELTIGTDASAPGPFHHGEPGSADFVGFDVDLCKAIASRLGLMPRFVGCLWSRVIRHLNENRFDMVCTAATVTEGRRKLVDFSVPYFEADLAVVVRRDSHLLSAGELPGKRIGVRVATTAEESVRARLADNEIRTYDYNEDAYRELRLGTTEAVIDDSPIARYFVAREAELRVAGSLPDSSFQYAIMFAKGDDALRRAVDKALAQIRAEGVYARVCAKWFGTRV